MQEVTLGQSVQPAPANQAQAPAPPIQQPQQTAKTTRAVTPKPPTPFTIWFGKKAQWFSTNIRKLLTLGFVFLLAIALSWSDGYFTLTALRSWIPQLGSLGIFQWFIHLAITALSVYLLPIGKNWSKLTKARRKWYESGEEADYRKYARARKSFITCSLIWLAVVCFNIGTSSTGLYQLSSGAHVELFGGFDLPDGGGWWRTICGFGGFIVGFSPEFLGHWIEDEWRNS